MKTKEDLNYWRENAEEDYKTTPISVLRYISELENAIRWIPVSERLPENRLEAVLLFNGDAPRYNQHIFTGTWFGESKKFVRNDKRYELLGTITHWMQLEPPKTEQP